MKWLNRLYYLKIEIDEIKKEIDNLSEISSSELSGMPHSSGVSNPIEKFYLKKQKLINKLNKILDKYIDEYTKIEDIIDKIDDPQIRLIARLRYIENLKWNSIGKKLHLDRSVCYKKLNEYLKEKNL